jgi:hypothetical protein
MDRRDGKSVDAVGYTVGATPNKETICLEPDCPDEAQDPDGFFVSAKKRPGGLSIAERLAGFVASFYQSILTKPPLMPSSRHALALR